MPTPLDVLRTSIETHNATFETLLSLIPPKYYLLSEQDAETSVPRKYQKHSKNQKAPKQASKKAKLDPANQKSIIDIQNEAALDRDDDQNDMDVDVLNGFDDDDMVPMPQVQSIAVLRDKLHARIAALHSGDQNGEPGDKDALLEERRKQRAALREKRRKETNERKRAEAERKKDKGKAKEKDSRNKPVPTKNQLLVPDIPSTSSGLPSHRDGPLTNVAFSALAGSTSKKAAQFKTASNPTQALTQLTARKDKMASMPDDKRKTLEDRQRWDKAEARIEGVKVRDNEGVLKKAIKRKEHEKARSKKKWEERKEHIAASMAARQKKRADNIAMRNERRNEKGKGGKSRPGFEGKSFSKGKGKTLGRKK